MKISTNPSYDDLYKRVYEKLFGELSYNHNEKNISRLDLYELFALTTLYQHKIKVKPADLDMDKLENIDLFNSQHSYQVKYIYDNKFRYLFLEIGRYFKHNNFYLNDIPPNIISGKNKSDYLIMSNPYMGYDYGNGDYYGGIKLIHYKKIYKKFYNFCLNKSNIYRIIKNVEKNPIPIEQLYQKLDKKYFLIDKEYHNSFSDSQLYKRIMFKMNIDKDMGQIYKTIY